MFVEDGPGPTDIAERTFLWVGVDCLLHTGQEMMSCHVNTCSATLTRWSTAHRAACVISFFITEQSPSSCHSVVCGFSVMVLSMARFRHVIRLWSGYYSSLIFSDIPGLRFLCMCVCVCVFTHKGTYYLVSFCVPTLREHWWCRFISRTLKVLSSRQPI